MREIGLDTFFAYK